MENLVLELEKEFDQKIAELEPYDATLWLGYPASAHVAYPDSATVLAALAEHGIKGALISHKMGELLCPIQGNRVLTEMLGEFPGCYGVMSLLPEGTGEIADIAAYVREYRDAGMRVARIFPKSHQQSYA